MNCNSRNLQNKMEKIITAVQSLREGKKICKPCWKSVGDVRVIQTKPIGLEFPKSEPKEKEKFDINEIIQSVNTDTLIRELNRRASKW